MATSVSNVTSGAVAPVTHDADIVREIPALVAELRTAFASGRTRSYDWRIQQLDGLKRFIEEREADITKALADDLGKPALEAFTSEIAFTLGEIDHMRKHLAKWMRPEKVTMPLSMQPGSARIVPEPYGVGLVISPWNYPFSLALVPFAGALAAGNCVVLKPSELSAHASACMARWLPEYVDNDCFRVVEGAVAESTALLAERFDVIFYTGNGTVGRIVMQAAAKHLTPVTLELGGKSPCIVDANVDLDTAVKRILWGKFANAGQTCIAPDYILAHESIHDALLDKLAATLREFYGDDPSQSPDMCRVINVRHHKRLMALMGSGEVVVGGQADEADRYIAPTVLKNVAPDSPIMGDEIFGPILPVLKVGSIGQAIDFVNERDKPLALYVFSNDSAVQDEVIARTSSGGVTVNHCVLHYVVPGLPFGGVGESGLGAYHGKGTFDAFTHRKALLKKPFAIDPPLVYPPYTDAKRRWLRRLM